MGFSKLTTWFLPSLNESLISQLSAADYSFWTLMGRLQCAFFVIFAARECCFYLLVPVDLTSGAHIGFTGGGCLKDLYTTYVLNRLSRSSKESDGGITVSPPLLTFRQPGLP